MEITLSPEEMEGLDEAGIKKLYEQKVRCSRRHSRLLHPYTLHATSQNVLGVARIGTRTNRTRCGRARGLLASA